jgi:asparagine synthetase B (glutamine-hydrolysing)
MCGILAVHSREPIPLEKHLTALECLESRGPDFNRYKYYGNVFVAQTVLHITGNTNYYDSDHSNFLAYNGEIYNFKELGNYDNDIEFVDFAVNYNIESLKEGWGPWAFAWSNGSILQYASDPQGERNLYHYRDSSITIVSSEVTAILEYIETKHYVLPYQNKAWSQLTKTVWAGIERVIPGRLYVNGYNTREIDSVFNWIQPVDTSYEHFRETWQRTCNLMVPEQSATLSFSGGLDSSLILDTIPNLNLVAVNTTGKDPIVDRIRDFLTESECRRLTLIDVNEKQWAEEYHNLINSTQMPPASWSGVGRWIVNKNTQDRILFTGCAADELFGGYKIYQEINYTKLKSNSPYSSYIDQTLWWQCLEAYSGDPRPATLLADYFMQVVGGDASTNDRIAGAWGIETRSPFMSKPMITLGLSYPWELRQGKPYVKRRFLERWDESLILEKKGFSGHCNDSEQYMRGVNYTPTGNRMEDWKQIQTSSFYNTTVGKRT